MAYTISQTPLSALDLNWSTPGTVTLPGGGTQEMAGQYGTDLTMNGPATNVQGPPQSMLGGIGSWLGRDGNMSGMLGGLGMLGQAWLGYQQLGAARDALNFQKTAFQANLKNSVQSYNNSLEDRIRGRTANPNESDVQAYLAKHQLTTG